MICIEQAQIDQLVQSFLAKLLPPQNWQEPFPAFLKKIVQSKVSFKDRNFPQSVQQDQLHGRYKNHPGKDPFPAVHLCEYLRWF